jgi:hypothetical protein
MPLQYLAQLCCSRTYFLYEVSHLSVPVLVCLLLSEETVILQARPTKNIVFDKEHLYAAIY